ncbi:MAG: transketolase [Hyphomicrobiaceae bacterium]
MADNDNRAGSGTVDFADMANAIRALSMDAVQQANSGHPGMPMGMADTATVLFTEFLKFDPAHPDWPTRDRFVLSAGHGSMLLYSLLYLTGYPGADIEQLRNFRQLGYHTAGHPEYGHLPGIETTTGPLGQGIANAVGMALAERMWNARVGNAIENCTYCIAGDGCLMEGISHEAISMAGHLGLGRLIVLFDDNSISIDGPTSLAVSDDQAKRFEASGWHTLSADGHDPASVRAAIKAAQAETGRPTMIAVKTVIGYGAPKKAGTAGAHGAPLGPDEIAAAREQLGWPHAPFEVPEDVLTAWRAAGARGGAAYAAWQGDWAKVDAAQRAAFENPMNDDIRAAVAKAISDHKQAVVDGGETKATRVWSQLAIEALLPVVPGLAGGSADLTGSNNTLGKGQPLVKPGEFAGSYIHFGVREHGMAAAMNGMALYGGFIPYGGTFLVFTDYCRPSIRLAALMGLRNVFVMTHDSIGLGEDGPTHQPVEHVASLRAMPNLNVFRPACGVETAECWELAVTSQKTPSVLALTRQGVVNGRGAGDENLSARGGYVLSGAAADRDVTLIATGSEVGLALKAADALAEKGVKAAVVSMPCMELFRDQEADYRQQVLGDKPRIVVEAGVRTGWDEWMQAGDAFVGMSSFGVSAPAGDAFAHFGITAEAVVARALTLTGK